MKRDLHKLFRAIVVGLSAPAGGAAWMACDQTSDVGDGGMDADATIGVDSVVGDVASLGDAADVSDVTLDSYVDWCEAGPPSVLGGDTCYHYFYVPCGLPNGEAADDAGALGRCDQICLGYTDDQCAVLPPPWPTTIIEAGLIDASSLTDGGLFVLCACAGSAGRMPAGLRSVRIRARSALGAYFAHIAHLEAASVPAFSRMHAELYALGAPRGLLADVRRAIRDERRHVRIVGGIAHRFGGAAGRPRVGRFRRRTIEAMARENAIEGCVRETFGALSATWQARHAEDGAIRRAMATIATDETRHAELAFRAARFFDARLDAAARARVESARRGAIAELHMRSSQAASHELVRVAGVPTASTAKRLIDAMAQSLSSWSSGV